MKTGASAPVFDKRIFVVWYNKYGHMTYLKHRTMKNTTYEYKITEENRRSICDEISEQIGDFCAQYLAEKRDVLRYRLSAEECLLSWLTEESIGKTLSLKFAKRAFGTPTITLIFSGCENNPLEKDNENEYFHGSVLRTLGLGPSYAYTKDNNILQFDVVGYSDNTVLLFVGVIVAALLVGILGNIFIPEAVRAGINEIVLAPVYDLFLKLLSLVSGPLIFLSVAWGIYGIGDTASLSKIGKSVILTYIRDTFAACACGLILLFMFKINYSSSRVSLSQASELINMIFSCVPQNIVEPFYTGNTLQIIFLAIVVGISLIYLGKKTAGVAAAIEQVNIMLQHMMGFISKLVPGLIFVVVISLFWSGTLDVIKEAWRFFLALIVGAIVIAAALILTVSVKYKLNPIVFIKKCLPTFVIALLTASSAATFDKTVAICNKELGIDPSVTSFGVPLGMVMHNPIAALNNLIAVLFFSEVYKIQCNYVTLIIAVIVSSILAIASPPIPGGGLIVYTMLFTQFGIPLEGIAVISAIDLVTDFIITATEMLCLFPGMVIAADKVGKLNVDVLRK